MTDKDLKAQMAQFEAARVEARVELEPAHVANVLAVLDGSDQDATVRVLAAAMAARTGAAVRELQPAGADALPEILAAAKDCQLVVVPSPFRRDYTTAGQQSLSTTVDLLLARAPAAVCLARAPVADAAHCVSHPLVALQVDRHRKVEATAFALALAQRGGELALLSVVDPQQPLRSQELLGRHLDPQDLSAEVLQGLATARAAALTAALQRRAGEWDVSVHVHFAVGDSVQTACEVGGKTHSLLVAGRSRDARSEDAQNARRLALCSSLPVLLV